MLHKMRPYCNILRQYMCGITVIIPIFVLASFVICVLVVTSGSGSLQISSNPVLKGGVLVQPTAVTTLSIGTTSDISIVDFNGNIKLINVMSAVTLITKDKKGIDNGVSSIDGGINDTMTTLNGVDYDEYYDAVYGRTISENITYHWPIPSVEGTEASFDYDYTANSGLMDKISNVSKHKHRTVNNTVLYLIERPTTISKPNHQLLFTTDDLHQNTTLMQQGGTRFFGQNLWHCFSHAQKQLDVVLPIKTEKMAIINNQIWFISKAESSSKLQQIHIYNKEARFLKNISINDHVITDIIQTRNKDVFVIAKGNMSTGVYIMDGNYKPSIQLTSSTKANVLKSMYAYGNSLFVLQLNSNILKVLMYYCSNVSTPHTATCAWVKKREFKFHGLNGSINSNFIVFRSNESNLGFLFSSYREVCMFDQTGRQVHKQIQPKDALYWKDGNINIIVIDNMNHILVSKPSGYYVVHIDNDKWKFVLKNENTIKRYDVAVDNVNKQIWFLQGLDIFFFFPQFRIYKYNIQKKTKYT